MELIEVSPKFYKFLYKLIGEKEDYQNISHKVMPTYEEHVKFNESKPYKEDYIIYDGEPIGRVYITKQNEIGIHILKEHQGGGVGSDVLHLFLSRKEPIYANISPNNKGSQRFFERHGFKLIQYTYKYEK